MHQVKEILKSNSTCKTQSSIYFITSGYCSLFWKNLDFFSSKFKGAAFSLHGLGAPLMSDRVYCFLSEMLSSVPRLTFIALNRPKDQNIALIDLVWWQHPHYWSQELSIQTLPVPSDHLTVIFLVYWVLTRPRVSISLYVKQLIAELIL